MKVFLDESGYLRLDHNEFKIFSIHLTESEKNVTWDFLSGLILYIFPLILKKSKKTLLILFKKC